MRGLTKWLRAVLLLFIASTALAGQAEANRSVPILVYHRFGPVATELTTIRSKTFAEELDWLRANNISVLPLHDIVDRLRSAQPLSNKPVVVLTADDGHQSVYSGMFPLILRYRVPVTLFIYPSAISNSKTALTWDQIAEMQRSGLVDVQSHTFWHPDFRVEKRQLDSAAYEKFVRTQLALSKSAIERHVQHAVDLLAWPFGIHNEQLEASAAEAGYIAAFGIDRRRVQRGENLYALPRFEVTDADRGARFARLILGSEGTHP